MDSSKFLSALGLNSSDVNSSSGLANAILASFQQLKICSEDYPEIAHQIAQLSTDIDQAHQVSSQHQEEEFDTLGKLYASRAKEYKELLLQIQSSEQVLGLLSDFLAQFQGDLSTVSTSIAELQTRSKLIETRLESRRLLSNNLTPHITTTIIPPQLILTIINSEPGEPWLNAIKDFEIRLTALKTLALEQRPTDSFDNVADKLRLLAAHKIRSFFINALGPFRASIATNLQITQSSFLLKYRPLFAFLQRHSARIAHEVQKAYVGTARWYFETGFRRYVRALEKIKSRGWAHAGIIAHPSPTELTIDPSPTIQSKWDQANVILAYMAESSSFKQSPHDLFRSLSLVVVDNAASEYNFVSHFFGQPSTKHSPFSPSSQSDSGFTNEAGLGRTFPAGNRFTGTRKSSFVSSIADSDSVMTGTTSEMFLASSRYGDSRSQTAIDFVWKQIVEPVFEYHKTFTAKLVSMNDLPDTHSIYAMIQFNEALISAVGNHSALFETHLMAIKMKLWPAFQIKMNNEVENMNQLSQRKELKETELKAICKKYVWFLSTMVGMESGQEMEENKVINELVRLRDALVAIIQAQATKLHGDAASKKSYLNLTYQEIQQALTLAPISQVRSQAEAAFWRELVWRTR
ncbi:hypothetical protein O181_064417 [Austropuccinia psidii MF-1]|uniref:Uncharacterized protein n=1 Tax=Austropuccinia psidii MF-1 TaxID=1389203 RepID=A0A9Q3EVR0_9BASI|nr:hypothetical protein [Austropuccinia psidii MF-1]